MASWGLIQATQRRTHRCRASRSTVVHAWCLLLLLTIQISPAFSAAVASGFLKIAGLGSSDFQLGALYDATTDQVLPYKLWDETYIAQYTYIERENHEKYKFVSGDAYSAVRDMFDMDAQLEISFMSGLVSVKGAASLFKEKSAKAQMQRVSMLWQRLAAWKSIRMEALFEHPERMYRKVLETSGATHVIIKILYGANYALMFEADSSSEEDASEIAGNLEIVVRSIPGFTIEGKASLNLTESQQRFADTLQVKSDGDVVLPAPILSYESAKRSCQNLTYYFEKTFHIGEDGLPIGGGNPGNPLIVVMAPLKDYIDEVRKLMYKISDDIVNEAVAVVERMDDILKRCSSKMEFMDGYLMGAFPRVTKEMQSFYNMINEFKQQTQRSIQVLLPKLRSGFDDEIRLSELVSQANRRLDLADPDGWLDLKDQEAAQLRGILDMLPRPVDVDGGCELTRRAQDWVGLTGFDDDQTVAIVLDFQLNQFLKPMRSVLMDATFNETAVSLFKLRQLSLAASTINRFKRIRSFVELNKESLRSVFLDRLSFPLLDVPAISDTLKFHFYSGGAVLCPAFYAPTAPTLFTVDLPTYNSTMVNLTWLAPSSCPRPLGFTIQISTGLKTKTVDMILPSTATLPSNVSFAVDVADMAQQGLSYGFSVRSKSAAGFSEWSNTISVVLQPTPAPIGRTRDWNWIESTVVNLTNVVVDLRNENADLRRLLGQSNARIDSLPTVSWVDGLANGMKARLSSLEGQVDRYNSNKALQAFMRTVQWFDWPGAFHFHSVVIGYDIYGVHAVVASGLGVWKGGCPWTGALCQP